MEKEEAIKILIDDEKEAISEYEKRHIKILEEMLERKRIFGD